MLGVCFKAFGNDVPPVGVLLVAYLVGQLGSLIPIPGGIGGVDGGLIGTLVLYGVDPADAAVAVIAYRGLLLAIPAILGLPALADPAAAPARRGARHRRLRSRPGRRGARPGDRAPHLPGTRPRRLTVPRRLLMEPALLTRILVVANRTASTPVLLDEIGRRARAAPCRFGLLIPDAPTRKAPDWTLQDAIPLLEREVQSRVLGVAGGPDTFEAVARAVQEEGFDEIIVSTLPAKRSRWRRRDLVREIAELGLPVTAVVVPRKSLIDLLDDSISMK